MRYGKTLIGALIAEFILFIVLRKYGLEEFFIAGGFIFMMLLIGDLINYGNERTGILNLGWLHKHNLYIKETLDGETDVIVNIKGTRLSNLKLKFKSPTNQIYLVFLIINIIGYNLLV
jgi:hypothetical protein